MFNLLNDQVRAQIVSETALSENVARKQLSFGQYEIYRDRILSQVKKYLEGFYSPETIKETPIVASVNLARRIVNKEASLYCKQPKRTFKNMSDDQIKLIEQVYSDMKIDKLMQKLNRNFKLQDHSHAYITPKDGKLKGNALLAHQFDVVPSSSDPEIGEAYLINGFDRTTANERVTSSGDSMNEMIADEDDYKAARSVVAWWSPMFNFITDEKGAMRSTETDNPIKMVPFVDIFDSKDGEYWVRSGSALTDFTIQFNAGLTDLGNIVRMQGFGQAYFKGSSKQKMQNLTIGLNRILHLPYDENTDQQSEFGYATANPDLAGSLSYLEGLLSSFLTSRGIDPKVVNTKGEAVTFNSGLERLLSMLEQFEATEEDISLFIDAENKILKIVIAYIGQYGGTPVLPNYPKVIFNKDASVDVEYQKPSSIQTESEKLETTDKRLKMGIITKVDAIMIDQKLNKEDAENKLKEINDAAGGGLDSNLNGAQMKSISDVIANVSLGLMPRDSAVQLVALSFGIEEDRADALLASAGNGFVATPGVKPVV